ncbi:MAG: hypothetical protein BWY57_02805 [Betaproteobacteria bacterium ADurb.Bin341]|jgi:hypothetical protein|nr:MAG: hypothetical protein BWY57_02805 [Betaproteobacteria bacterium ADurb.Bin341]
MPVESKIYSLLSGSTVITSVTSTRIYPMAVPQGSDALPALVYSRISGHRVNALDGYSHLENPTIQFDCWATSYAGAKDLSTRVANVMGSATSFEAILVNDLDALEWELGFYRLTQEWSVWHKDT